MNKKVTIAIIRQFNYNLDNIKAISVVNKQATRHANKLYRRKFHDDVGKENASERSEQPITYDR